MSEQQNQAYPNPYQTYPYYQPQTSQAFYPTYNTSPRQNPQSQQWINPQGMLPMEQSYIENILRLNRGKLATVYMTFENNTKWNAKIFKGIIEAAGRDHIILSNPETGERYLLLMIYLDYVTFDEEINYSYPVDGGNQYTTSSPR